MASDNLLEMRAIRKGFPGVQALSDVNFNVRRGEVHAIIGHNGAGKSTLIKILTGAYAKDSGQISLLGQDVSFHTPAESQTAGIATIYQEVNLVPYLTAPENIFLGREPRGRFKQVDWARMRRDAATHLSALGVSVDLSVPVMRLSVALQQMVALARAVSLHASLVVMDEPTSSLDTAEVRVLFEVIRLLQASGVGIIYISHRMEEIFTLAQRVTILRNGQLVATLPIGETDTLSLVALMLGRKPEEVRASGKTAFSEADPASSHLPVLEVEGLSRGQAPRDVSLRVGKAEIVGLAGLLGSGRTEVARTIFGADRAERGTIRMGGKARRIRTPRDAVRAGIGMVSEDRKTEGIVPALSVSDNILLAALPLFTRLGVLQPGKQRTVVDQMIQRLDIRTPSPKTPVRNLSGGNQQKVILARWLCRQPKLLILDEPTRGIDVGAKAEIQRLIDELAREQGMGILMISSELEEVIEGSDRVAIMKDGRKLGELRHGEASEDRVMHIISEG
ncbi:MAG TPA: sugar ABC transporter ATP-binding protein [Chloroflexota bacterium]